MASDFFDFGTRYDVFFFCVEVEQIPCCGQMLVFPNKRKQHISEVEHNRAFTLADGSCFCCPS